LNIKMASVMHVPKSISKIVAKWYTLVFIAAHVNRTRNRPHPAFKCRESNCTLLIFNF
jgi:hypothetical protein